MKTKLLKIIADTEKYMEELNQIKNNEFYSEKLKEQKIQKLEEEFKNNTEAVFNKISDSLDKEAASIKDKLQEMQSGSYDKRQYEYNKAVNELNNYAVHVNILFDSIESLFASAANERNEKYHKMLNEYYSESEIPISQKAVNLINSLNEVSATLVGMRRKNYVDDMLESMKLNYVQSADQFWKLS